MSRPAVLIQVIIKQLECDENITRFITQQIQIRPIILPKWKAKRESKSTPDPTPLSLTPKRARCQSSRWPKTTVAPCDLNTRHAVESSAVVVVVESRRERKFALEGSRECNFSAITVPRRRKRRGPIPRGERKGGRGGGGEGKSVGIQRSILHVGRIFSPFSTRRRIDEI